MPLCGNCGNQVASSDIICPHCDVLLAAYVSPVGAAIPPPVEIPVTDIPVVDLEVPPPHETPVVTDPAVVSVDQESTAPRPLFETDITVEDLAKAAESDHTENLVIRSEPESTAASAGFDAPAYARPPQSAQPIPPVEAPDIAQAEANVPSVSQGESWLTDQPQPARVREKRTKSRKTIPPATDAADDVGETEAYLRKLHRDAGYDASNTVLSKSVDTDSSAKAKRKSHNKQLAAQAVAEADAQSKSTRMGCFALYSIVLIVLWISFGISLFNGNFNPGLLFIALALTWGQKYVNRAIDLVGKS